MKRKQSIVVVERYDVAPHGGAWIETSVWGCSAAVFATSPLTEGRGLKRPRSANTFLSRRVAPHGGAWIETILYFSSCLPIFVAPHGGAWIETCGAQAPHRPQGTSPLTEGRGLKRTVPLQQGAVEVSPLTEGRGLKHLSEGHILTGEASRPSRRGVD